MRNKRTTMEAVAALIRARIAGHQWRPGERIPTKGQLQDLFGASDMTVQRALNLLNTQGFTKSRGCKGTFAVERPPHLHRFGLILSGEARTNLMRQTLAQAAQRAANGEWWLTVHEGCTHWAEQAQTAPMAEVTREVDESRFAGLVFVGPPFLWAGSPILTRRGLPRLFLADHVTADCGAGCRLERTWRTAFAELVRRGRQRVALVGSLSMVHGGETAWLREIRREAEACGLTFREEWAQAVAIDSPGAVRQAVRLLLSLPARFRPDGLFIMDDHLVTAACEAVAGSGIPMNRLTVMTHANFPNLQPAAVPVVDVGYDLAKLLEAALQKVNTGAAEGRELGPADWIIASAEVRERVSLRQT